MVAVDDGKAGNALQGELLDQELHLLERSAVEADLGSRAQTGVGIPFWRAQGTDRRGDIGVTTLGIRLALRHGDICSENGIEAKIIADTFDLLSGARR